MNALFVISLFTLATAFKGENKWRQQILNGYDKNVAPKDIGNKHEKLGGIDIGISLRRIEDFSTSKETLTLVGNLYQGWLDRRLTRKINPQKMRSILGMDGEIIWKPTLRIFNTVKKRSEVLQPVHIYPIGLVYSTNIARFNTQCTPTLRYYPFDKHTCQIVLGVMTAKGEDLETHAFFDFTMANSTKYLIDNPKWKLLSLETKRQYYKPMSNDDIVIPAKIYTIEIERHSPLIALGLLTVAVLSVVFGLLPFWLPLTSSFFALRLALCVVGLLISGQTSEAIYKFAPAHQGQTPLIAQYCVLCSILTILSLLETILMSQLTRLTSKPSNLVKSIVNRTPSQLILRFWGTVNGSAQDDGRYLFLEDNLTADRDVNWTMVALLIDSVGFILELFTWIVLCLMCISL